MKKVLFTLLPFQFMNYLLLPSFEKTKLNVFEELEKQIQGDNKSSLHNSQSIERLLEKWTTNLRRVEGKVKTFFAVVYLLF